MVAEEVTGRREGCSSHEYIKKEGDTRQLFIAVLHKIEATFLQSRQNMICVVFYEWSVFPISDINAIEAIVIKMCFLFNLM